MLGVTGSWMCRTSKSPRLEPAAHPGRGHRAEVQPGHGPVVAHRASPGRPTRRSPAAGCRSSAGASTRDVVALAEEVLGEVADVELHPAGHVEGVGADDADPHGAAPSSGRASARGRRRRPAAACASPRCARGSRRRARRRTAWVMAVALERVVPVAGPATGSWKVMTTRCRQPGAVGGARSGSTRGAARAPVARASAAGSGGHPGPVAAEVHLDPPCGQVAVGQRAADDGPA